MKREGKHLNSIYHRMLLQKYRISRRTACGNSNRIGYLPTYSRYVSAITDSRNVKLQEAVTICRTRRLLKKKGAIEIDEFESLHRPRGIHARADTMKKSRGYRDANLILRINENFRGRGIR